MKKIIISSIIAVAVISVYFIASGDKSEVGFLGQEIPVLNKIHVSEGTKVDDYNSNPPTSGRHWPNPANWGLYTGSLPDEQLVHNLEHGGIWISYKDINEIDDETGRKLEAIAEKFPEAVIITERPQNQTKFAIVSWGRLHTSDYFDQEFAEEFINRNINNSPEKLASLEQSTVKVGNIFPDFSVTEVDGRNITRSTLKGKPAIVWFTTEFCVPCQIGAREVSKLDDELGGNAFEVVVIFVDPRETDDDLRSWRERFARDDWMVAFDNFDSEQNSLSPKVGLKYLDSKYLLDKDGVIKDIDFQIAGDKYLNLIRQAVKEN